MNDTLWTRIASRISAHTPGWALPFVTRSFRGKRGQRMFVLSLLVALVTIGVGHAIALGDSEAPRELRVALGFEESRYAREHTENRVIVTKRWHHRELSHDLHEAEVIRDQQPEQFRALLTRSDVDESWNGAINLAANAYSDVWRAAATPPDSSQHRALHERATRAVEKVQGHDTDTSFYGDDYAYLHAEDHGFQWWNDGEVRRLENILDHGYLPRAEAYSSPLGIGGAIRMTGALASILLGLLFFVIGPVLAAVTQAQESHENTLMPLIGTSLTPRALALGLLVGAVAPVLLIAAPLIALVVASALLAGSLIPAALFLGVTVAGGLLLAAGGQLVGQFMGRRRTPGAVAMSLLALTGIAAMTGLGIGFEAAEDPAQALAILPQAGASWLIAQGFGLTEGWTHHPAGSIAHLLLQAAGAITLALFTIRALARRLALTEGPTLTRREGFTVMATTIAMVMLAAEEVLDGSFHVDEQIGFYFATLVPVGLIALLVTMGRVPLRDAPPSMCAVPLRSLLLEFFAFAALHLGASVLVAGPGPVVAAMSAPGAVVYAAWAWSVVGLLAVRMAALPPRGIVASLSVGLCAIGVGVAMANGVELMLGEGHPVIMAAEGGATGGLIQVLGFIAIPAGLLSTLRARLGAVRV